MGWDLGDGRAVPSASGISVRSRTHSSPRNIHLNPSSSSLSLSPEEEGNGETQRWAHHSSPPSLPHVSYDLAHNQPTVAPAPEDYSHRLLQLQ